MPKSTSNKRKFFSVDCDFFWQEDTGKNYRALRSRFGNDGLMFYFLLQAQIHSTDEAYFKEYTEDWLYYISEDLHIGIGKSRQIMKLLCEKSMLDSKLLQEHNVMTSTEIQLHFQELVRNLKRDVVVDQELWLLKKEETLEFIKVRPKTDASGKIDDKSGKMSDKSEGIQINPPGKEHKGIELNGREGERSAPAASPSHSPQNNSRDDLINRFGEVNVQKYERKFRVWAGKKPDGAKIDMYRTIGNWLEQDGVTKPQSGINPDDIVEELRKQYS